MNLDQATDFFFNPSKLHKPFRRGERSEFKTNHCGVYVWYVDSILEQESCLIIPREGAWDLGKQLIFYVGESHIRTVCKRLKAESKLRADQSQPQMGLGCLLHQSLGLELREVPATPQYLDFWPDKNGLFEWMQCHARFAFIEVPDPDLVVDLQYGLIDRLRPLINLQRRHDREHPFEDIYRDLRNEMWARARGPQ